jgi:tetratricopeptide (TPR) repeat protein
MPCQLLEKLLPLSISLYGDLLKKTKGFLEETPEHSVITRHVLVADAVFRNQDNSQANEKIMFEYYRAIIEKTTSEDETLIKRMNKYLMLCGEQSIAYNLLRDVILPKFPQNLIFMHIQAMLEWRFYKNFAGARELFKNILDFDNKSGRTYQAWGIMEKEAGNKNEARELFAKAIKAGDKHAPAYQAWAILEKEEGNIDKARELFAKAVEVDDKQAPAYQACPVRRKTLAELTEIFLWEENRKVDKTGCVHLMGNVYEVDLELCGQTALYDRFGWPSVPNTPSIRPAPSGFAG